MIVLSARGEVEDRVAGLDLGATDYMGKPFSFDELRGPGPGPPPAPGAARGHPARGRRDRGRPPDPHGHPRRHSVELSPREFGLLAYFLRHPNHVLSREQILSAVWGYDYDPAPTSSRSTSAICAASSRARRAAADRDRALGGLQAGSTVSELILRRSVRARSDRADRRPAGGRARGDRLLRLPRDRRAGAAGNRRRPASRRRRLRVAGCPRRRSGPRRSRHRCVAISRRNRRSASRLGLFVVRVPGGPIVTNEPELVARDDRDRAASRSSSVPVRRRMQAGFARRRSGTRPST